VVNKSMKAWKVSDTSDEWVGLFHAETAGKAKLLAMEWYGYDDYLEMRARRFPEMDDREFTYQDCKDAGFQYWDTDGDEGDEDGYLLPQYFINDCPCDICKGVNT
jgi:hypothetical protein